jgi:thiamine kinase-like enzyme
LRQVLGTFENGRVERFMEGMRHLDPAEMARPDLVPLIARRLAQFHAVDLGEAQEPQVFDIINKWCAGAAGHESCMRA